MDSSRTLPLRVLYTVNGSPQYILARSRSTVPVTIIRPQVHHVEGTSPVYGTTPLKICLDAVCLSSPELAPDGTRDFSVYVLDPLESESAPASVPLGSDSTASHRAAHGVAVGLGLMSLALDEECSPPVTGTIIKTGTGQDALEVVFALRETIIKRKRSRTHLPKRSFAHSIDDISSNDVSEDDVRSPMPPPRRVAGPSGSHLKTSRRPTKPPSSAQVSTSIKQPPASAPVPAAVLSPTPVPTPTLAPALLSATIPTPMVPAPAPVAPAPTLALAPSETPPPTISRQLEINLPQHTLAHFQSGSSTFATQFQTAILEAVSAHQQQATSASSSAGEATFSVVTKTEADGTSSEVRYAKSSELPIIYAGPPRRPRGRPKVKESEHPQGSSTSHLLPVGDPSKPKVPTGAFKGQHYPSQSTLATTSKSLSRHQSAPTVSWSAAVPHHSVPAPTRLWPPPSAPVHAHQHSSTALPPSSSSSVSPGESASISTPLHKPSISSTAPVQGLASPVVSDGTTDPNAALLSVLSAIDWTTLTPGAQTKVKDGTTTLDSTTATQKQNLIDALKVLMSSVGGMPSTTHGVTDGTGANTTSPTTRPGVGVAESHVSTSNVGLAADDEVILLDKANVDTNAFSKKSAQHEVSKANDTTEQRARTSHSHTSVPVSSTTKTTGKDQENTVPQASSSRPTLGGRKRTHGEISDARDTLVRASKRAATTSQTYELEMRSEPVLGDIPPSYPYTSPTRAKIFGVSAHPQTSPVAASGRTSPRLARSPGSKSPRSLQKGKKVARSVSGKFTKPMPTISTKETAREMGASDKSSAQSSIDPQRASSSSSIFPSASILSSPIRAPPKHASPRRSPRTPPRKRGSPTCSPSLFTPTPRAQAASRSLQKRNSGGRDLLVVDDDHDDEEGENPFLISPLHVRSTSGKLFSDRKGKAKASAPLSPPKQGSPTRRGNGRAGDARISPLLRRALDATEVVGSDADSPSGSVPVASSDGESETEASKTSVRKHEHWRGLPPSSPPPPSSPQLEPVSVPLPTLEDTDSGGADSDGSDSLHFVGFIPKTGLSVPPSSELSFATDGTFAATFGDALEPLVSLESETFSDDPGMSFDELSDMLGLSSEPPSDFEGDTTVTTFISSTEPGVGSDVNPPPLPDIDFGEFWESFKPLVFDATGSPQRTKAGSTDSTEPPDPAATAKLAEGLQALFGGCLV